MYNLALFHVPQAKQKIFLYKFAECERVWTALSNFSLAPNDRYSHFIVERDGPEVRMMSLFRLETCSVYPVGNEMWDLSFIAASWQL